MERKIVSAIVLALLIVSILVLAFNIQPVKVFGTIYIKANGTISPSSANITTVDKVTYTFTGNVNDTIVVQRNNTVINGAGYTLHGKGSVLSTGVSLSNEKNVTIKNMKITGFYFGIYLSGSSKHNRITGNFLTANATYGIYVYSSSNNSITGNNINASSQCVYGIYLYSSSNYNTLSGNNITGHATYGIYVSSSSNNVITGNNVNSEALHGIYLYSSSNHNTLSGNNVKNNHLGYGIYINVSSNNVLRNNNMSGNDFNFGVFGEVLSDYVQNVDSSNIVNGKPIYYWVNRQNMKVPSNAGYVALVNSTNITVQNLSLANNALGLLLRNSKLSRITGNNITYNDWGVILEYSSNNTISGNRIIDNSGGVGIGIGGSSNNTISGNYITQNYDGVRLLEASSNNMNGNNITSNNYCGIWLNESTRNYIYRDSITKNGEYGILLDYSSSNNTIYESSITSNIWDGISLSNSSSNNNISGNNITANTWSGISLNMTSFNTISQNFINWNLEDGIILDPSVHNTISENDITGNNESGISLFALSSNNSIQGNDIRYNIVYGICFANSSNNVIFHNNFINNTQQVFDIGVNSSFGIPLSVNTWNSSYPSGGNYWSNYTGVDKEKGPNQNQPGSDGIGDTPQIINSKNKDGYPLMKPVVYDVAVTNVTLQKTIVGRGYLMQVYVTVLNHGNFTQTFTVTLYANTTSITSQDVTLKKGTSTIITFTWNTTGFAYGNYTVSAKAAIIPGETDTADNTRVDGTVAVRLAGDFNGDGVVDPTDFVYFMNSYSTVKGVNSDYNANCDFNNDGKVDVTDFLIFLANYGKSVVY